MDIRATGDVLGFLLYQSSNPKPPEPKHFGVSRFFIRAREKIPSILQLTAYLKRIASAKTVSAEARRATDDLVPCPLPLLMLSFFVLPLSAYPFWAILQDSAQINDNLVY